jgi:hypothetical protein
VPIDISAVADPDDPDDEDILLGRIDDAVVADTYSVVVLLPPQLLEAKDFREGINAQDLQDLIDADSDRLRESLIFPEG